MCLPHRRSIVLAYWADIVQVDTKIRLFLSTHACEILFIIKKNKNYFEN